MAVLQDININVHGQPSEKRLQTFLRLSQNENGRMINFRVLGPPLPSNCTATFSGTKPDGNVYSKAGTVTGNFVVIEEDIQMTAFAGVWDAKLDIINGTHNIMTALIRVVVDADVVDPDAIASDSQLQGLVAEAKYYAEHARTDAYGSPLTAALKAEMTDKTHVYVYTGSEPNMVAGNWYHWNGSAWVSGGVYNAVAVQTDTTLSVAGKPADGKAAGDAIEDLKEDLNAIQGISEDLKVALLACFSKVAWIDSHGSTYYSALYDALYPTTGLVSLTAVFNQGNNIIYADDSLNVLKAYLTVTGHYDNGTSQDITDYTLSGTLTQGTSTITVSVGTVSTTFTVTVSAPYWNYSWDASSGVAPSYFQAHSYDFTTYPDAMFVENFYFDFNHVGDAEIEMVAKSASLAHTTTNRTPQISIRASQGTTGYNGFKASFNTPSGNIETNLSGTFVSTGIDYLDYHKYRVKWENGVGYLYVDDVLVEQGSGVTNNAYIYMTGVFASLLTNGQPDVSNQTGADTDYTKMAIKSIKYRGAS